MEKLRVPYGYSVHGEEEQVAAARTAGQAMGKETAQFESLVAANFGKKHGIMVNSGSSANLLALYALELRRGSEVITPVLTFSTTIAPIVQWGLIPVFVDVDPATFVVNIDQVEAAITKKTRVLMIPNLIGNIPNLERLQVLAKKHGLVFLEDSCDTLGGLYKGKPTGSYSHISTTSFYGSHIINAGGGGGMICVDDDQLARRLKVLRAWGRESSLYDGGDSELVKNRFHGAVDGGIPYDNKFLFTEIGFNVLPLEMQAAFGLVQLRKLPEFAELRKKHFDMLYRFFESRRQYFLVPETTPEAETVWLAYPVLLRDGIPFTRTDIQVFLEHENIQTRPIFTGNILRQPAFRNIDHRKAVERFENADFVTRNGMLIACHHGLTAKQMEYLMNSIDAFLAKYG